MGGVVSRAIGVIEIAVRVGIFKLDIGVLVNEREMILAGYLKEHSGYLKDRWLELFKAGRWDVACPVLLW